MGAVKAIGIDTALRVAEIENIRDGIGPEGVCPESQSAHQIGGSYHDLQMPRRARQHQTELTAARNR